MKAGLVWGKIGPSGLLSPGELNPPGLLQLCALCVDAISGVRNPLGCAASTYTRHDATQPKKKSLDKRKANPHQVDMCMDTWHVHEY